MMIAKFALTVLVTLSGWLSAYDQRPTDGTIAYHQGMGNIPMDLSAYDGLIAVLDCGLIGTEAELKSGGETYHVLVFDCAGIEDGGAEWMVNGGYVGEIDYYLAQEAPQLIGAWGELTFLSTAPYVLPTAIYGPVDDKAREKLVPI